MGYQRLRDQAESVWALARRQHGVVSRSQLLELGVHSQAIKHRVAKGRLHPIWRGVYAIGRPELTVRGKWMAAVLCCGSESVLSHGTAAVLWGIQPMPRRSTARARIDVSVGADRRLQRDGIRIHRSAHLPPAEVSRRDGIPVTSPTRTLIDLGTQLGEGQLEAAVNQADKLDLIGPEALRVALDQRAGMRGSAVLRRILDRRTFALTDSELERRFLRLASRAGLPRPLTGERINGFKVDFYWPDLGLIVETDGLRYHRTAAQQARDKVRDQAHAAAGLTTLRFTHAQVRYEPEYVIRILTAVASRLRNSTAARQSPGSR